MGPVVDLLRVLDRLDRRLNLFEPLVLGTLDQRCPAFLAALVALILAALQEFLEARLGLAILVRIRVLTRLRLDLVRVFFGGFGFGFALAFAVEFLFIRGAALARAVAVEET